MALVDPSIALSYKPVEIPQQRNMLAEAAQVMNLQQAQMQMNKIRQNDEAMERIRQAAVKYGGPDDLNEIARAYMSAPDPQHQALGLSILQKQKEKADFEKVGRRMYPELFAAAPAAAAPAAAAPLTAAAPANALAPTAPAAAPANALAAPAVAPAQPLSPSGKTRRELEGIIFLAQQNPLYKGMAETAKLELQEMIKGQAPTNLARLQRELAALPPGDPRRAEYQALIKKETTHPQGTTVVNVQEKAEAGAFGKMLVDQYQDISKAAGLAIKTLPSIEANLSALNKGLDTGFGTEAKAAGARILGALGVEGAEKLATDTQTFQSNAINAVLQKQLEQKGPQTESDARRIEQVGAELGKTKAANEFILSMAKEQLRRDVEQRNFYDKWKERTGSFKGAESAWFEGEGSKSLFDRPALKKYAPGPSAVQQIPGQRPVPAPTAAPAAAARTVVRTGTLNGRRVVQYSDGSTAYAD